jgi:omptin
MKKTIIFSLLVLSPHLFANSVGFSLKTYTSQSRELVYSPSDLNRKVSELIWKINNAQMLGFHLGVDFKKNLGLQLEYKSKLSATDNLMDDYDWIYSNKDWSHHSNHPNTQLVSADIFKIAIVKTLNLKPFDLHISGGVRRETRKFKAYDGTYIYSNNGEFRNLSGSFSGLGITYSEEFTSIYGSAEISKDIQNWHFLGNLTISPFYTAKNKDTHHLRNFTNSNEFDSASMFGLGLGVNYAITKNLNLGTSFEYFDYSEAKGTTTRKYDDLTSANRDNFTQLSTSYEGAGISNNYSLLNIYLKYSF